MRSSLFLPAILCALPASPQTPPTDAAATYAQGKAALKAKDYATARTCFEAAGQAGHAEAMNDLGDLHYEGQGVPQDRAQALAWYRKSAALGLAKAEANIGYLYGQGLGVPKDPVEAARWYRRAAEKGNPNAQNNLGYALRTGQGVTQNSAEAERWYLKAAEQGYALAQQNLGEGYYRGYFGAPDYDKAFRWFQKAADQGNLFAMDFLAFLLSQGQGAPVDGKAAYRLYLKAAMGGFIDSQIALGKIYRFGEIDLAKDSSNLDGLLHKDLDLAREWFEKAAAQGSKRAYRQLASMALEKSAPVEALKWYTLAAEAGDVEAYSYVAELHSRGGQVPWNEPLALEWAAKGSLKGDGPSWHFIISRLKQRESQELFGIVESLAGKGQPDAAYFLGRLYIYAESVEKVRRLPVPVQENQLLAFLLNQDKDKELLPLIKALGLKGDSKKGYRFMVTAAKGGVERAYVEAYRAYESGWGVPQDLAEAARWRAKSEGN